VLLLPRVQGALVWKSPECSSILSLLLNHQQQQQSAAPPQQHQHAQCSRRSDAWEDWAGWALEQEQQEEQQQQAAAAGNGSSSSRGLSSIVSESWLMSIPMRVLAGGSAYLHHLLLQQQRLAQQQGSCSSGTAGAWHAAQAAAGASAEPACAQVGLVFCYANNMTSFTTPDWRYYG
jgi:hypothetical protein